MQTRFTEQQLQDPRIVESDRILRSCVHCGFCLATCPTYLLSGDELESPRGRIYLIKEMLEKDRTPTDEVVRHIDQCLSCLSCLTTCPSGVNYMHLIDEGRARIEERYRRPLIDRIRRHLLAAILPSPRRFYLSLRLARLARPLAPLLPRRWRGVAKLSDAPVMRPARPAGQTACSPAMTPQGKVGLLAGCVQRATGNDINGATLRVLNRLGYEVRILNTDCCGAIEHHLGRRADARKRFGANIEIWNNQINNHDLEAIVVNASGCGTMLKDYGYLFGDDARLAVAAERISQMSCDITEFLGRIDITPLCPDAPSGLRVAVQNPCSMQHGQNLRRQPAELLAACGYEVLSIKDDHLCCGSAGTYNLLQPEIASELGRRKAASIEAVRPDVIASGNLGCMAQIAACTDIPIRHTIELLDRARYPEPTG